MLKEIELTIFFKVYWLVWDVTELENGQMEKQAEHLDQ